MLKKTVLIISLIGLIGAIALILWYLNPTTTTISTNIKNIPITTTPIQQEVIATGLNNITTIKIADNGDIIFAQKNGFIGQIQNQDTKIIKQISNIDGILSIALDPEYNKNSNIYICYRYADSDTTFARVDKINIKNADTKEEKIIDKLPSMPNHDSCVLGFGPDNKLYISVGDGLEGEKAQYPDYLNGKILRLNKDGTTPDNNPYPKSNVRSIGHRNIVGLDRDSKEHMYASEQGPSIIDGQPGGDEINYIVPKGNYGWNKVSHEKTGAGLTNPILTYTPAINPGALIIYKGATFPERGDNILVATKYGILRIQRDAKNPEKITHQELITTETVNHITIGPDGDIYTIVQSSKNSPNDTIQKISRK